MVREVRFPPGGVGFAAGGRRRSKARRSLTGPRRRRRRARSSSSSTPEPDVSVPEADEPTFQFAVYADVTDAAGETRSAERTFSVGYTALQLATQVGDWLPTGRDIELVIRARTLDGEPQPAEGLAKVYALRQPERVQRASLGEFRHSRPGAGDERPDLSDPNQWELAELVLEQGFSIEAAGVTTNRFKLPAGAYRAMLESQDRFGKKVTARQPLVVVDPEAPRCRAEGAPVPRPATSSVEPGGELRDALGHRV